LFIGHFAVGFASKRVAPRTSLGTLMLAALFLDALWPVFLLCGIERVRIEPGNTAFTPLAFEHYPVSHSLFMALVWAVLFALLYRARTGFAAGALWVGVGLVSHWVLDFVTHRPDLPLLPFGSTRLGLGLCVRATAGRPLRRRRDVAPTTERAGDRDGRLDWLALHSLGLVDRPEPKRPVGLEETLPKHHRPPPKG
jgi:hypothetical protein